MKHHTAALDGLNRDIKCMLDFHWRDYERFTRKATPHAS